MDHFCAYASGQFKESEKNYHVIYKEILAVKYGKAKDSHVSAIMEWMGSVTETYQSGSGFLEGETYHL